MSSELTFATYIGADIAGVFPALAALRIRVFRDFPYLYEGSIDYELRYLQTYADAPDALLFSVWDGGELIGATTGIPLRDETAEVRAPFETAGYDLSSIFYFGESILLPEYRGRGLGHRFFDEREAHALRLGYVYTCFCAVVRPADHPLRPSGYQPLDVFWQKRGYARAENVVGAFEWPDIGEQRSTFKPMQYWLKRLDRLL
jgi:GNAT superfamily N-acetyltransferase